MKSDEAQIERRVADAKEIGKREEKLDHLIDTVERGFSKGEKRFDSIDKKFEDLELKEMSAWFKKRQKLKEMIVSVLIKKGLPTAIGTGAIGTGFVAYFTDFFK